jgi:hypothetical protein
MESNIMVALALKLQNLFPAGEDKFLTFPMGLGLTNEELDFLMDDPNDTVETIKQKGSLQISVRKITKHDSRG